jgi:hypothetical protein
MGLARPEAGRVLRVDPVLIGVAVGVLDADRFVITRTYRLEFPGGSESPPRTAVFGRGAELHILTRDTWHKVSVNDLPG